MIINCRGNLDSKSGDRKPASAPSLFLAVPYSAPQGNAPLSVAANPWHCVSALEVALHFFEGVPPGWGRTGGQPNSRLVKRMAVQLSPTDETGEMFWGEDANRTLQKG